MQGCSALVLRGSLASPCSSTLQRITRRRPAQKSSPSDVDRGYRFFGAAGHRCAALSLHINVADGRRGKNRAGGCPMLGVWTLACGASFAWTKSCNIPHGAHHRHHTSDVHEDHREPWLWADLYVLHITALPGMCTSRQSWRKHRDVGYIPTLPYEVDP